MERLATELTPRLSALGGGSLAGPSAKTKGRKSKSGFLYLRRRGLFGSKWKLVWVVCDVGFCTVYAKRPEALERGTVPSQLFTISIFESVLSSVMESKVGDETRWSFRMASRNGTTTAELGGGDKEMIHEWHSVVMDKDAWKSSFKSPR